MKIIGSKAELKSITKPLFARIDKLSVEESAAWIHSEILKKKIRFPILESFTKDLFEHLADRKQISFLDRICNLHEIGGNVILGYMLQLRLKTHFKESFDKAEEYIIKGDQWYVCDIIGERVLGHALLTEAEKTLVLLKAYRHHHNVWMVRSIGVAVHYAIKKGLKKEYVDRSFQTLLSCAGSNEFHIKKGIGWAVKTTAKFHPDIISKYSQEIDQLTKERSWFRTKLKIGLSRSSKYASRYTE